VQEFLRLTHVFGSSSLSHRAEAGDIVFSGLQDVGAATERSRAYVGGLAEICAKSLQIAVPFTSERIRMPCAGIHEALAPEWAPSLSFR